MEKFIYSFNKLLPYFFIFPIFIILVIVLFKIILRKNVSKNNIHLFGLFIDLNNKDILLLCLLLVQFYFIISSLFINDISYTLIFFLLLPILIFSLLTKKLYRLIANFILTIFIFTMILFKSIFFTYLKEVTTLWYVEMIYVVLCLSIIIFAIFNFLFNFNVIIKNKKLKDFK